jgi:hypothetical protein
VEMDAPEETKVIKGRTIIEGEMEELQNCL